MTLDRAVSFAYKNRIVKNYLKIFKKDVYNRKSEKNKNVIRM